MFVPEMALMCTYVGHGDLTAGSAKEERVGGSLGQVDVLGRVVFAADGVKGPFGVSVDGNSTGGRRMSSYPGKGVRKGSEFPRVIGVLGGAHVITFSRINDHWAIY